MKMKQKPKIHPAFSDPKPLDSARSETQPKFVITDTEERFLLSELVEIGEGDLPCMTTITVFRFSRDKFVIRNHARSGETYWTMASRGRAIRLILQATLTEAEIELLKEEIQSPLLNGI